MEKIIKLTPQNIDSEHICCAISDKKCAQGYQLKKDWVKNEMANGYTFLRIDARAKVFIEYCNAETGWTPIIAPNYLLINCFWVSGQYKGHGYAKELLRQATEDAIAKNKSGLVTVVGKTKFHFMSDTKWLLRQGFEISDNTSAGFCLLVKKINNQASNPTFAASVKSGECDEKNGLVVYYTNRCPFTYYHVNTSLPEMAQKRGIPFKIIKLETNEQAQAAPTPATIFSLFYNGKFITTDLSACMDSRFDKIVK